MKKILFNKLILKWVFSLTLLLFVFLSVYLIVYGLHLSKEVADRFSGRRWSIPSKVYSDTTILYPGQRIIRDFFYKKLFNLGYRNVPYEPKQKGEIKISSTCVDIFLNDFNFRSKKQSGFPVRIKFLKDRIESIVSMDNTQSMPILELEPEEIMLFFGPEREQRQLISIHEVPEHLIFSLLAAEDRRFYHHHGVDPIGMLRALFSNIIHGHIKQGGSTLTQQLAKNYFLTPERTFSRKYHELLLSIIIELIYEKNEILEIYLNEIYLGQQGSVSINGIGEAAYFYFGKHVSELSLSESATIAGLIKAPNYYSPYINKERCRNRRNVIIQTMFKNGWASKDQLTSATDSPVKTVGFTAHFREAPYFVDYLSKQLAMLYSAEKLSSLGLKIYTTLDTQVQMAAERALEKGLARLEKSNTALVRSEPVKKLQGAVIVIQPKTGYILAMVGGRDYSESQFNRISQARRQPGSAFKPFVFLSGLDKFTPASRFSNAQKTYMVDGKKWEPQNFESTYEDKVSMRTALAKSCNLATIDLAIKVGLNRIVGTALDFGFSTPLGEYPSISLGAFDVIPIELAQAYCVFAADGVQPYLLSLKNVLDENDEVLERRQIHIKRLISPEKAFIVNSMLRSVVTDGTARSLRNFGISFPVSGKTGTTNNYKDAWFIGYTPDILALIWVGFDNGDSMYSTGSQAALPIWADMINAIPQYVSGEWFRVPPGVVRKIICSETGEIALRDLCPEPVEEFFLEDNFPETECDLHGIGVFKKLIKMIKDLDK
ncbi:MAG: PBP1A family penicillin-binding protein [Proteobacteria bacterium]|nr:PBP1A family penicillin-binding protein [Pseudomonadota bacterium]